MSNFEKISRVSTTTQVVNAIKASIQTGRLKTGDKLPSEAELSKELGVGRSSLREGMRILEAYGVVEIKQGEGTFLVNNFAEHVFEFLGFYPSQENVRHTMYVRRVMEVGCAGMIYDKLDEEQCKELKSLAERIVPGGDTEQNIRADAEFHSILIKSTRNPLLAEVYRMLCNMIAVLMHELMSKEEVVVDARTSHLKICKAFEDKNYQELYDAITEHMTKIDEYYEKYYSEEKEIE